MKRILVQVFHFAVYSIPMHLIYLITGLIPNSTPGNFIRGFLLRPFFKKCGRNFQVASGVIFIQPQNIEIGQNVYIAHNAWIGGGGGLIIGDEVIISPMALITSGKHTLSGDSVRYGDVVSLPTKIGNGSWISSHVTVCGGVTIGDGVVVAANAAVTKDISDNSFAYGVPANYRPRKGVGA